MPATLNADVPAGSDAPSTLDNVIREFKVWVEDVFGLADDVAIATALGSLTANGLIYWTFFDVTTDPASAGRLGRNGANLLFHDGTAARTLVSTAATQTLTNKTLTSPVITTPALSADSVDAITEIAAALKSGADGTLITGTEGTSGDLAIWNADGDLVDGPTPPTGTIVGTSDTQTLTTKTMALGSNTVSGTLAEFNTALTDANFATLAGIETLTNKTLTAPVLSGSATGTYTLAGTPTITSPTLNTVAALDMGTNVAIIPAAVSGTPAQHALFQENVPKAWGHITWAAGTPTLQNSFNVASITDAGAGDVTVTFDRDFAAATYAVMGMCQRAATNSGLWPAIKLSSTVAVGSVSLVCVNPSAGNEDADILGFAAFGDQ